MLGKFKTVLKTDFVRHCGRGTFPMDDPHSQPIEAALYLTIPTSTYTFIYIYIYIYNKLYLSLFSLAYVETWRGFAALHSLRLIYCLSSLPYRGEDIGVFPLHPPCTFISLTSSLSCIHNQPPERSCYTESQLQQCERKRRRKKYRRRTRKRRRRKKRKKEMK